ncbi:MFS transporter [Actinomadura sp. NPDC000600]|uniref:MFS transporter n=1 Tax=Actinomadura sp. NPDC000600 TaxID=3154262 RepID=UPI00339402A8
MARASVGVNLGQLLAPWAATVLLEPVGVRGTYLALGLTGLTVTAAPATILPRDGRGRNGPAPAAANALRGRGRVLTSFALHSASLYMLVLLLPKYATELGWSATHAGRLITLSALAAGLTALAPAWLIHQLSAGTALAVAAAVHALSGSYRGAFALGVLLSLTAAALIAPAAPRPVATATQSR